MPRGPLRFPLGQLLPRLVLIFVSLALMGQVALQASSSGGCVECSLLYKFCPANVGCGFADPSGITCYCQDWSWCSDFPDCSEAPFEVPSTAGTGGWPLKMKPCNSSDPYQWIVSMDTFCENFQHVTFSPRDVNNSIVVLSTAQNFTSMNHSVFAAYVPV